VERVDLQQLHVWNPEWIGREEWRRAFEDLRSRVKQALRGYRSTIISRTRAGDCRDRSDRHGAGDLQHLRQSPESHLFALAQKKNVGVIARVPLDEGSLTGKITEDTKFEPNDFRNYYSGDRKKQVCARECPAEGSRRQGWLFARNSTAFCLSNPAYPR